ncbi:unnamed protein product [Caenorhabditis angaria]|uniref:Serpentine Receptor, class H n=1 Tax=Caenorhabditis angaria TaxID=860376 RepID=A0A9P1IPR8_9PELO|nr:unnamed protein product [Caenorhabditis angaria]
MVFEIFASPDILVIIYEIIGFLSIPVYILGFYCVIKKCPKSSKTLQRCMLMTCFWSVILDINMTIFVKPLLMFPEFCVSTLGVLNYINFPKELQCFSTIFAMAGVGVSCVCIIENRYHHIKNIRYTPFTVQVFLYSKNLSLTILLLISVYYYIPEQQNAKRIVFEKLPTLDPELYSLEVFILSIDKLFTLIQFVVLVFYIIGQFFMFFAFTYYELFMITNIAMSASTRKFQRLLFIDVTIQSVIPILCICIPFIFFAVDGFADYYNQGLNNVMLILFSLHGIVSVSTMVLIHRPFRKFVFRQKSGNIWNKNNENTRLRQASIAWMTST